MVPSVPSFTCTIISCGYREFLRILFTMHFRYGKLFQLGIRMEKTASFDCNGTG
jgi:hypothetical protein